MPTQIIDLSALYWRNWHASDGEEVSTARRKTLGFVRSLYGGGRVIVALDSPPYNRSKQYPEYKANRPVRNEAAIQELVVLIMEIKNDGWEVAYAKGYEADDVICTLVQQYKDAVVYGTDKDLLQCCDVIEPWSGRQKTAENTLEVKRDQVVDYLTLLGDSSDNLPGVKGVGPKTARALLETFGDLSGILAAIDNTPDKFKPKTLEAFKSALSATPHIFEVKSLIELQDCSEQLILEKQEAEVENKPEIKRTEVVEEQAPTVEPVQTAAIAVSHETLGFRQSLEPMGVTECWRVSEALYQSRLYSQFPTPQAIMATIMRGRALGLDATTSLDGIHVIKGKPTMAASLMVGLVLSSPQCEFLYCHVSTDDEAVWSGKRVGMPREIERGFTIKDAQRMQLTSRDNWKKQPAIMLKWRCASLIIRELFPDVINGLYSTEEMQ